MDSNRTAASLRQADNATLAGEPILDLLEKRLGRRYARQRLGIEKDHEAQVFGQGINFFHIENLKPSHALIRATLLATGLYWRGVSNAAKVEVRHNRIASPHLPRAFDGYTILQLSDLHVEMSAAAMRRVIAHLKGLQYDLCVLTGDYRGDTYGRYDTTLEGMGRIREALNGAVYGVLGNHDTICLVPGLEEMGIKMLLNESETLERGHVRLALGDGSTLRARLIVAADGRNSKMREGRRIPTTQWRYTQTGIVCTVTHELPHEGVAHEHFLPAGPFAILPLVRDPVIGHRSSIVWTEETHEAERIVALPDAQFHAELERRFGLRLGDIEAVGPRRVHPLGLSVARAFIADRIALVGDAAHVIHPIAGQGLNMGLKDVAALAEVIVDAARLGLDPGSLAVLDRYQRWRRFDTVAMGVATDGLNRLFSNRSDALRLVRDVGLGLVDRLPALKQFFIREAAGLTGEVPKLLRGEAL